MIDRRDRPIDAKTNSPLALTMLTRFAMRLTLLVFLFCAGVAVSAERTVKLSAPLYFFPPVKEVTFTVAGSPGPGAAKHVALAESAKVNSEVKINAEGPIDVWITPKDGRALKAVAGLKFAEKTEVKLNDHLGVIRCKGADLPRGKLIVTDPLDRGPEDKQHAAIQSASDSRTELIVPPGDYAVWISPDTGARARRIAEKVRVLPGRTADVD